MKLTPLLLIPLFLLVFGSSLTVSAQQDSTNLDLYELKQISKLLSETEYRREKDALLSSEISAYESVVKDFMNERQLWIDKEKSYLQKIELVRPDWWNKFYIGAGSATLMLTIIYYLVK